MVMVDNKKDNKDHVLIVYSSFNHLKKNIYISMILFLLTDFINLDIKHTMINVFSIDIIIYVYGVE
jgi:hypothetical protein